MATTTTNPSILASVPTCELQWELERREGISARRLGLDDAVSVLVNGEHWRDARGPLTVTINTD